MISSVMQFALRLLFYMKVLMNLKKMQYFNAKMYFFKEKNETASNVCFFLEKTAFLIDKTNCLPYNILRILYFTFSLFRRFFNWKKKE